MKIKKHTNGIFYAHYTGEKGEVRISLGVKNEREANRLAREAKIPEIESMAKSRSLSHEAVQRAVAGKRISCENSLQKWEEFLKTSSIAETTIQTNMRLVRAFLTDRKLDKAQVSTVDREVILDYLNSKPRKFSSNTRALVAIRRWLEYCLTMRWILVNPGIMQLNHRLYSHKQMEPKKRVPFTDLEVQHMLTFFTGFWRSAVILAKEGGFRLGDVATLEWDSFDTETGRIVVWTRKRGARVSLPMTKEMKRLLKALPKEDSRYVFPVEAEIYARASQNLSTYFPRELKKIGLDTNKTFHSLRSNFVKANIENGKTVDDIRESLGHTEGSDTMEKHYFNFEKAEPKKKGK